MPSTNFLAPNQLSHTSDYISISFLLSDMLFVDVFPFPHLISHCNQQCNKRCSGHVLRLIEIKSEMSGGKMNNAQKRAF